MTSLQRLRADARQIFAAGVRSADPAAAVKAALAVNNNRLEVRGRSFPLSSFRRLFIAGCGKAAAPMARAAQEVLRDKMTGGVVVVKYGHGLPLRNLEVIEAGHPIPDTAGMLGARRIMDLARQCGKDDLFLFLLSGGASALCPCPAPGLSLDDKQRATEVLLRSGAMIHEVNAVRKHISQIKGGRLAQLAAPAQVVALILSDVADDAPAAIGSGPTAPDPSNYDDCLEIIQRYRLADAMPPAVLDHLRRGGRGEIPETPKPSDPVFKDVQNLIIGSNRLALTAARQCAETLGYQTWIVGDAMAGESRLAAKSHGVLVRQVVRTGKPVSRPACLLSGGETTVTVTGDGLGGRNQEFALAAAMEIERLEGVVILSGGTDGTDGPTEAAGGIVDGTTTLRAKAKNFDPEDFLTRNDSYRFLRAVDDLLVTGPTLTNVMDLQVTLIG